MRVAVLATGGKDSALALYHVLQEGYTVKCLATVIPLKEDSWMFHYPNIQLVDLFAEAAGIPVVKTESSGVQDKELEDLKQLIEKLDVEGMVSGAIASSYQKSRLDELCKKLGLKSIAPLWQRDQLEILNELLKLGFEVVITGVYAHGFDVNWLGKKIDESTVEVLKKLNSMYGVSLVGEGGEYETFVLDAPFFKKKIKIVAGEKIWKGQSGQFLITKATLENKISKRSASSD